MENQQLVLSVSDYEQRVFIKFGTLLNWSTSEIHRLLTNALGSRSYSIRTVRHWVQLLREGRTDVRDERGGPHHVCHESTERALALKQCMDESRAWSLRSISERTGIPKDYCRKVLTEEFGMTKKLGKWIPHELSEDQLKLREVSCKHNLLLYKQRNTRLNQTLAIDETWVSLYRPPEKDQQKVWLSKQEARPSFTSQKHGEPKRLLILAMDFNGIAFWYLCEKKETVTSEIYKKYLNENIPQWMSSNGYTSAMLLHDNARPHKAALVSTWLKDNHVATWEQPAYSPDLNPCDYNCFHQLKRNLGGKRYKNWKEFTDALEHEISEGNESGRYHGVQMLPQRWEAVIENEGAYL